MGQIVSRRRAINQSIINNENDDHSIENFNTTNSEPVSVSGSVEYNHVINLDTKCNDSHTYNSDGKSSRSQCGHTVKRAHTYPSTLRSEKTINVTKCDSNGNSTRISHKIISPRSSETQAIVIGVDKVDKCNVHNMHNMHDMYIDTPHRSWRDQSNDKLKRSYSSPENHPQNDKNNHGCKTIPGKLRPSQSLSSLGCWDRYSFSIKENGNRDLRNIECCKDKGTSKRLSDHNDTTTTYQSPWETCVPETPVGTKISVPFTDSPVTLVIDKSDDMTIINSFRPLLNTFPFTLMDFWAVETVRDSDSEDEDSEVLETFVKAKKQQMVWKGCINTDQSLNEFVRHSSGITFAPGVGVPGRIMVHKLPVYANKLSSLSHNQFSRLIEAKEVGLDGTVVGLPLENSDGSFRGCVVFYSSQPVYSSTISSQISQLGLKNNISDETSDSNSSLSGKDVTLVLNEQSSKPLDIDSKLMTGAADVMAKNSSINTLVDKDTSSGHRYDLVDNTKTVSKDNVNHVRFQVIDKNVDSECKSDPFFSSTRTFSTPTITQQSILDNPIGGTLRPISTKPQEGYLDTHVLYEAKVLLKMMVEMYNENSISSNSTTTSTPIPTSGSGAITPSFEQSVASNDDLILVDQMAAVENKDRRKMTAHEIEWDLDVESSIQLSLQFQDPDKASKIQSHSSPKTSKLRRNKSESKGNSDNVSIKPCGLESRLVDVLDFGSADCIVYPGA